MGAGGGEENDGKGETGHQRVRQPGGLRGLWMDSPQAHRSTGFPYGSFRSTSGERYPGVPANPAPQTHRQADIHREVGK